MKDLFGPTVNVEPLDGDKGRKERGAFYTPDKLALAICESLETEVGMQPRDVLEPGCGGGSFLRAIRSTWNDAAIHGVDLAPACDGPGFVETRDLFTVRAAPDVRPYVVGYSAVIGNPDYAIAERVIRHCMTLLSPGGHLAFLLRAAFLGSSGRVALYNEFPLRALQPVAQRPSFTPDGGSDPSEYSVFIWQRGHRGRGELLPPLVWK